MPAYPRRSVSWANSMVRRRRPGTAIRHRAGSGSDIVTFPPADVRFDGLSPARPVVSAAAGGSDAPADDTGFRVGHAIRQHPRPLEFPPHGPDSAQTDAN